MRSASNVGAELTQLVKNPAFANVAPTLTQLAGDLVSGDVGRWRRVDVLALCNTGPFRGDQSRGWRNRALAYIDLTRNLLLFLPLLLTWGGIYLAVQAYRALLSAPASEQVEFADASFLQMWTRGFGGRTWATLDLVAVLDFSAILLVILLFVGGAALQRRVAAADATQRQANAVRLRSVLTEVNMLVAVEDDNVIDRLSEGTKELLDICEDTMRRLLMAQKELTDSVDGSKQSMAELATATKDLAASGASIARNAERLNAPAEALARTVETVESATGTLVRNTADVNDHLPGIRQGLLELFTGVRDLGGEVRDLYARQLKDMKEQVPVYQTTVRQLVVTQKELVASIEEGKENLVALTNATGQLAASGNAIVDSSDGLKQRIEALTTATDEFGRSVGSLVAGASDMNKGLPPLKQGMLDVLANIRDVGGKLDNLYAQQEVIAQELGVLADNPLATAEAAKRTAVAAKAAEDALLKAIRVLPTQMDQLRAAVVTALDRELQERHAAARALAGASEATRLTVESAVGSLLTSSREATDTLRHSIDQLRESPKHVLPDLSAVAAQLTETLDHSRVLVDALVQASQTRANGQTQANAHHSRWWWPPSWRKNGGDA